MYISIPKFNHPSQKKRKATPEMLLNSISCSTPEGPGEDFVDHQQDKKGGHLIWGMLDERVRFWKKPIGARFS